ncbi:hypothetical protein [Streptomyces sp. CA-106131]
MTELATGFDLEGVPPGSAPMETSQNSGKSARPGSIATTADDRR